jgi:hypothetical protein
LFDAYGNPAITNATSQVQVDIVKPDATATAVATFGSNFTAVAGEVSLSGMHFESTPDTYKLRVRLLNSSASTIHTVLSSSFTITHAAPAQILLTTPAITTAANALIVSPAPNFIVQDRFGYAVANDNSTVVTVSIAPASGNTGSATVSGEIETASNGVVRFPSMVFNGTPGDYQITFTAISNGVSLTAPATSTFTLTPGAPASLRVDTSADGARSRIAVATAPVIRVLDAAGNTVTMQTIVTATLLDENGNAVSSSVAQLNGDVTRATDNGIADFGTPDANSSADPLIIRGVAGNYTLRYSYNATTDYPAASVDQAITLRAGVAAAMVIATNPVAGKTGEVLTTQPAVQLRDADDNPVLSDSTTVVSASVIGIRTKESVSNVPIDGRFVDTNYDVLGSAPTQAAANGVARFSGLQIKGKPGDTYGIKFTAGSIEVSYSPLVFTASDPAALQIVGQPVGGVNGDFLATAPRVQILDRFGYTLDNDGTTYVTAEISSGTDGSITGATVQASNGVASFNDLKLSGLVKKSCSTVGVTCAAGARWSDENMGYKLTFKIGSSIVSAESNAINLSPATASKVEIVRNAAGAASGKPFTTSPKIEITDFTT